MGCNCGKWTPMTEEQKAAAEAARVASAIGPNAPGYVAHNDPFREIKLQDAK